MLIFHSGLSRDFDGPGERLVFYLKGCNFRCDWCASPESISPEPEMLYYPDRNKDLTSAGCPFKAYACGDSLDRSCCKICGDRPCINIWHNPSLELAGVEISPEAVLTKTEEMRDFIDGVTFGGGEPTLQMDELEICCPALKKAGIHTAVESNASTAAYPRLIGKVDLLYSDLKTLDPAIAEERMSANINLVKQNLSQAAAEQQNFILRIPVISQVNTSAAAQEELLDFCDELNKLRPKGKRLQVELLRQHHLGAPKYRALGLPYKLSDSVETSPETVTDFAGKFKKLNISAVVFS